MSAIASVAVLVADYDVAIDWFRRCLRFELVEDRKMGDKRWVVVAAKGPGPSIVLARAANGAQRAAMGRQAGGRVWLFLQTDDFAADYAHMRAQGVEFEEDPRHEDYGTVAVFRDLSGNRWDLLQRAVVQKDDIQ